MPQRILQKVKKIISHKCGLLLSASDTDSLRQAVAQRMASLGLHDPHGYLELLERGNPSPSGEEYELLAQLAVGESYFFRDAGQFELLRMKLLPELIAEKSKKKSLRIWSAGCASGEEPYSLAILLDGLLGEKTDWRVTINGTDIKDDLLRKAEEGMFGDWSFRGVSPDGRARHFRQAGNQWAVKDRIKRMVKFRKFNLLTEPLPNAEAGLMNLDLVLCRNLFIYYDDETVARMAKKIVSAMADGGYLLTGHGELRMNPPDGLHPHILPGSVVYKKGKVHAHAPAPAHPAPQAKAPPKPASMKANPAKVEEPAAPTEAPALILAGKTHADRGDYPNAVSCLRRAIKADPLAMEAYFLLAMIETERGKAGEAKALLEKALYLNPTHMPSNLELASLYEAEGRKDKARAIRVAAVEQLQKTPPSALVEGYEEMTAVQLHQYLTKLLDSAG